MSSGILFCSFYEEVDQEFFFDVTEEYVFRHDHGTETHADQELPKAPSSVLHSLTFPDFFDLFLGQQPHKKGVHPLYTQSQALGNYIGLRL